MTEITLPIDDKHFCTVRIYQTHETMARGIAKRYGENPNDKMHGAVVALEYEDFVTFEMYIARPSMTVATVSHECVHLALRYDCLVNGSSGDYTNSEDEERLADLVAILICDLSSALAELGEFGG